jgi:DnaJ-class molecular chaperone
MGVLEYMMDVCKYLRILNLNDDYTLEDVKYNYRKLCLKYHPDKENGSNDKFVEITEAYNYLVNHSESQYKSELDKDVMAQIYLYMLFISTMWKIKDIEISIVVDLSDVYNSCVKKISYTRVNETMKVIKHTVYLELDGIKPRYKIDNLGDYNPVSKVFSDLVINVSIFFDSPHITINNTLNMHDLYYTVDINLYQYFFGIKTQINYLNNEQINVYDYIPNISGDISVIKNKGLPDEDGVRENLYIIFQLDLKKNNVEPTDEEFIQKLFCV